MTQERNACREDWLWIALMALIMVAVFGCILFTDKIIRASDVITQLFWNVKEMKAQSLSTYISSFPMIFQAEWNPLSDGGRTLEGGWNAIGLLVYRFLILHFFPFPADIAWLAVLSLLWGGIGAFFYCRLIGSSRIAAFTAGILFALCVENASLINAGHIQKIEAISWAPWVFFFLEKAFRSGRFVHYSLAALMLAVQFFTMHWQISFYTCLATGLYWFWYAMNSFREQKGAYAQQFGKDLLMAGVLVALFFSTIAMSFAPLYSWSQQSERGESITGTTTGSNGGAAEKGIGFEEGMSWSMPPEEMLTFIIPGMFGYSRQEAGDVPAPGQVYYWGRMRMSQTNDYLGLLPWFLLPLPLVFRRDRLTWFMTFLVGATLIMALGKYTLVYRLMFEYLPGFSKFRVPKMILFLLALGTAILAARGIEVLKDEQIDRKRLTWWLWWCAGVTALTAVVSLVVSFSGRHIVAALEEYILAPTRYQNSISLVDERLRFMVREGLISTGIACAFLAAIMSWFKRWLPTRLFLPLLLVLAIGDLWRVESHFLVTTAPPEARREAAKTDIISFLESRRDHFRVQPMNGENAFYYADHGFANISAYVTISERRYKQFLEAFSLMSPMPDIMNLKYVMMPEAEFEPQKAQLAPKFVKVFSSTNGSVVLENTSALPKAWLVPSAAVVVDPQQRLTIMASAPDFRPDRIALVESPPPLLLEQYPGATPAGTATIRTYEPKRIVVDASALKNCLLVIGEKYYRWWYASVDGRKVEIVPVDHVLRGVYLPPGKHVVEFVFDPLPFKVGKYLTLCSLAFFAVLLVRERIQRKREQAAGKA